MHVVTNILIYLVGRSLTRHVFPCLETNQNGSATVRDGLAAGGGMCRYSADTH